MTRAFRVIIPSTRAYGELRIDNHRFEDDAPLFGEILLEKMTSGGVMYALKCFLKFRNEK